MRADIVDATCARLMGLEPDRVPHIHEIPGKLLARPR
jgi:hypothetical protein